MGRWLKKNEFNVLILLLLVLGFFTRTYFVDKVIVGDLMNYAEWGTRLTERGPRGFYFSEGWYYSIPVYPPVALWTFAGLHWLNEQRFLLPELHNITRFPPAAFIIYFYKWGNILLLKLPTILADLGLSLIIYKLILSLTGNKKSGILGMLFYLFNPITIFVSGAWGQTDSVVAVLGLISFLLLLKGNAAASIPIMFLGLYFKPSWAIFGPFYLYLLYYFRPKLSSVVLGAFFAIFIFVLTTQPFSEGSVLQYGWKLFRERYPLPIGIDGKASISAFNFQTIFFRLDIDYAREKLLAISAGTWGLVFYVLFNIFAFVNFDRQKNRLFGLVSGLFAIGMGSFLFMATMLERYFFPAFAPMLVLAFARPKILWAVVLSSFILAANIVYSFYRRGSDEIYHFFIDNNFLLIRLASALQVAIYFFILKVIQFESGTARARTS